MNLDWQIPSPADQRSYDPAEIFAAGEEKHHIANTAYPIGHQRCWAPYRVARSEHRAMVSAAWSPFNAITLYSHIPFCETRCYFCEYTVVGRRERDQHADYMALLNQELAAYAEIIGRKQIAGFDIGGGTPAYLPAELIAEHISAVGRHFEFGPECEISIETTPRIAAFQRQRIADLYAGGIRRISMGLQVTDPDLLRRLNRDKNGAFSLRLAADNIRAAGFRRFNLDLMYGFAGQSMASLAATLEFAIALAPEYITLYRMRYKLTRISDEADGVDLAQVRAQARLCSQMLADAGYRANPGKNTYVRKELAATDTGTSAYLTRRVIQGAPYLGIGLGAQSFSDHSIAYGAGAASKSLGPYRDALQQGRLPIQDLYHLPRIQMCAKMAAVSFYFGEINLAAFESKFGVQLEAVYPAAVQFVLDRGLMEYVESANGAELGEHDRRSLALTEAGARHFNGTIALFYAPSVQAELLGDDGQIKRNRRMALAVAAAGEGR